MLVVAGFELEGHSQLASGLGDRFCKFKQGEMRFAPFGGDCPASIVIRVNRAVHVEVLLAEISESSFQRQAARPVLVRERIKLGLDRRENEVAVAVVSSRPPGGQRFVRQNLKTQLPNSGGRIGE